MSDVQPLEAGVRGFWEGAVIKYEESEEKKFFHGDIRTAQAYGMHADAATEMAKKQSTYANSQGDALTANDHENASIHHDIAGNLHKRAADEYKRAGNAVGLTPHPSSERHVKASAEHFDKADTHYKTAQSLRKYGTK